MNPRTLTFVSLFGLAFYYVAFKVAAWIGRTVGPWFLVWLALGTLVGTVAYLVVGELRDRKQLNEPWFQPWEVQKR